jgi:hypothetical protein
VMLIEFYDRIYLVWSDILVEISKWNQPWFWPIPRWNARWFRRGIFLWLFCHKLSTCAYIQVEILLFCAKQLFRWSSKSTFITKNIPSSLIMRSFCCIRE